MAPGSLIFVLLLLPLGSAIACLPNNISGLSCYFNYKRTISCEWATNCTDMCSVQAHNYNFHNLANIVKYNSSCALEPPARPGPRRCSLRFSEKVRIQNSHVLFLNLSCVQIPQSWVTFFNPICHIKPDAPSAPVVNGSSLSWTQNKPVLKMKTLQYEMQWTPQHRPLAGDWNKCSELSNCPPQCSAELQTDCLVRGQNYCARVRVRGDVPLLHEWSMWSEWSPTLSWTSTVGRSQKTPSPGSEGQAKNAGLWTAVLVTFTLSLIIVFWTSRVHWVYIMKVVKGVPLSSSTPSVLKMGWQRPLFSRDFDPNIFKSMDIITSVELLPPEFRPDPDCLAPPDENPSESLRCSMSSFSNPMYSQLCPQHSSHPNPDPDLESEDPHGDTGVASCSDIDLLQLLMAPQSQGVPVVCEYEKVEAVGAHGSGGDSDRGPAGDRRDRLRLTSVDSGMGSGEEVSQESLHLEDHTVVGSSAVEDQAFVSIHTQNPLSNAVQVT